MCKRSKKKKNTRLSAILEFLETIIICFDIDAAFLCVYIDANYCKWRVCVQNSSLVVIISCLSSIDTNHTHTHREKVAIYFIFLPICYI